ncbi:MAG: aminotransferase class IV [Acidimicrobiia bacterium]|nr:aminotransferase class IV [Acidimicrobiia bacterium]
MSRATAWRGAGLVDPELAGLPLDDRGFLVGDACFETCKVVAGRPFALTRHLRRLARSCAALGIAMPDPALVRSAVVATVGANEPGVGRLRITVTAGRGPLGPHRAGGPSTLVVLAGPPTVHEPTTAVALAPWVRNERSPIAGVKSTSYAENAVVLAWARERGCTEALLANTRGELCEGGGSNVFVVLDRRLVTPPLSSGCLAGVTRELVLELPGVGIEVEERAVPMTELARAAEAFLTSSTRDVHPVHALDGRTLPAPGPVTAAVQAAWRTLVATTDDP